ncbi:MAG: branched-chain amino acid ABC transporter permease [Bacillota bacterium]
MRRYIIPVIAFAVAAALPFVIPGNYRHNIMALMGVYAIAALGLNLLVGIAGQISMGHGAFMLIGGYGTAFLTLKAGLPIWLSVPLAGVVAGLVGFVLGLPALRLHGHFLALATLSFGVAIPQIALKWDAVTGGAMGLSPAGFPSDRVAYWVILGVLALLVWVADNLLQSRPGRALRAVRDSEIVAQSMGVSLVWAKTSIFALSAFYAGVAGALATHLSGFIAPTDFNLLISFQLLATIVVGGLGSITGSIAGAVLVTFLPFAFSRSKGWAATIEGFAIIGIVMFLPYGLASLWSKVKGVFRRAAA